MPNTIIELKVKAIQAQVTSIEEAIRTAQFIRNKCLRLWMDSKGINKYELQSYCKVLAKEFKFAGELNANPPYPPSEEGGRRASLLFWLGRLLPIVHGRRSVGSTIIARNKYRARKGIRNMQNTHGQ